MLRWCNKVSVSSENGKLIFIFFYFESKLTLDEENEPPRKKKKRLHVGEFDRENDWYSSNLFSKETILAILYAGYDFIKIAQHQPSNDFMEHLKQLCCENPQWAENAEIGGDQKWRHYQSTLKAMWRKYQFNKKDDNKTKFTRMYNIAKTVYRHYLL